MPLSTRSQNPRPSDGRSPSGVAAGDAETRMMQAESSNDETNEKRDFQPPPSAGLSTPSAARRELAPSSGRRSMESQMAMQFAPPGTAPSSSPQGPSSEAGRHWQPMPPQARASPYAGGRPSPMQMQGGPQDSSYPQYMPQTRGQGSAHKSEGRRSEQRLQRPSPAAMQQVGSLGSIAAELDLAAKEHDDFGPTVADCLNLGSFGEDDGLRLGNGNDAKSSRREDDRRPSPKSSPPPGQMPYPSSYGGPPSYSSYRGSAPLHPYEAAMYLPANSDRRNAQPNQPPYGGSQYPGGGAGYPYTAPYPPQSYPPLPPPEPWTSPPAFKQDQGNVRQNPKASPPSTKRGPEKGDNVAHSTPRKTPKENPTRSPFRSPIANTEKGVTSSGKKFKRSPLFGAHTPSGYYGSFGMDTPGGTLDAAKLDEFSPMGPSFPAGFGDETTPFPLGVDGANVSGIQFDPKLNINRVASGDDGDERKRPVIRQRRAGELTSSPFSSFLGDMSPLAGDIRLQSSPMEQQGYPSRFDGGGAPPSGPPLSSSKRGKAHLLTSPVASMTGSGVKQKKQPWYDPLLPSPGPVRLELGDVGMKPSETRRGLEGINTMLRSASTPHQGGYDSRMTPSSSFRRDLSTPIKVDSSTPASGSRNSKGQSALKPSSYPGSASGKRTPSAASAAKTYPPIPKSAGRSAAQTPAKSPAIGKENATPKSQRRNPCNCKKSKCLKLYCECFAGELFCDKCNCYDCRNTPAYEELRAKAIKDTRAKNPNAFKPRIAVRPGSGPTGNSPPSGHNMGCRCKRSECLKKYCECFQAGVMCGNKCKCVECLNYVGSQPLIDKRRKIKDHKGAEFAMRTADDAWKGKPRGPRPMHPLGAPSPAQGRPHMHMPPMIQPSPGHRGGPRGPNTGPPPPYGMAPYPMGPPMGYSPMGMPPVTPGYATGKPPMGRDVRRSGGLSAARGKFNPNAKQQATPRLVTPRTRAVRLGFDPHTSKKKRKLSHDSKEEPSLPYFGPDVAEQPKTMALAIFSYLSNDDLYNAGIVCKRWSQLALDGELWQF